LPENYRAKDPDKNFSYESTDSLVWSENYKKKLDEYNRRISFNKTKANLS